LHKYRTHTCSELTKKDAEKKVKLSGWIHRKRDHGNLLFFDLRDHFGLTQCVIENTNNFFKTVEKIRPESVVRVSGKVVNRSKDTINRDLFTGEVEIKVSSFEILSESKDLPMPIFGEQDYPEETRLKYRFLDLRRQEMHDNIILRSKVISYIRNKMISDGFLEFQTPILTASSPEGARDFLVPSRMHHGKFYALPQAPQQFKQMVMISGFDKYFQIAPCFRDEDGRADRSPGEHYQLDIEMSFVEQEDVFKAVEPIFYKLFTEFGKGKTVSNTPFKKISFDDSMLQYGTDKPDLRNPLKISDVTDIFNSVDIKLNIFKKQINKGAIVRAIPAPNTFKKPRSFYDSINEWAKTEGANGLAYLSITKIKDKLAGSGPIAKFFSDNEINKIVKVILIAALGTLLLTISAKIKIPFYPVPMTMQTFVVVLMGIAFGWKIGVATISLYLFEGVIGLPVFAGTPEKGVGLVYFTGPTMGYLIGFLFATFIAGYLNFKTNIFFIFTKLILSVSIIYIIGILWLGNLIGWDKPLLQLGVTPFLLAELFKISLLTILAKKLIKFRKFI